MNFIKTIRKINPPTTAELNDYYKSYWDLLTESDLFEALKSQTAQTVSIFSSLPAGAEDFRYGKGKWMIKEVAGHLCDTERIMTCRALRFARNDQTPLSGYDENSYMLNSHYSIRPMADILEEYKSVRNASLTFFSSLNEQSFDLKGVANGVTVSPRIILYFILVHERHHMKLIDERYLKVFA